MSRPGGRTRWRSSSSSSPAAADRRVTVGRPVDRPLEGYAQALHDLDHSRGDRRERGAGRQFVVLECAADRVGQRIGADVQRRLGRRGLRLAGKPAAGQLRVLSFKRSSTGVNPRGRAEGPGDVAQRDERSLAASTTDSTDRNDGPCYSNLVTTNAASPRDVRPALARAIVWETDAKRFSLAVAVCSLIPAAVFAPILHWRTPDLPLLTCFAAPAVVFAFAALIVLLIFLERPEMASFRRTLYRFELFEHGVELRDGHGAILGETANGTLRVVRCNVWFGRQMVDGARLEHHGGTFLLLPNPTLAPSPGMPAVPFVSPHLSIAGAAYQHVLALAE